MVHVYKKSATPIKTLGVMRTAGANNVGIGGRSKYLVLWNAQVARKDGMWHYVLDFDPRESLEKGEIAKLMTRAGDSTSYIASADWKALLGSDFEVISAAKRTEIVRSACGSQASTGTGHVTISCTHLGNSPFESKQEA